MKYELIFVSHELNKFEEEVNEKLKQGYELYKSPIVKIVHPQNGSNMVPTTHYYQAIIKK